MNRLSATFALRLTALAGFLAVALGAFGAHALRQSLTTRGTLDSWTTGVLYHLVHVAAMLAVVGLRPFPRWPWVLMLAGVLCFSGSLYLYALTEIRPLVFVTPIGGLFLLAGWFSLAFRSVRESNDPGGDAQGRV